MRKKKQTLIAPPKPKPFYSSVHIKQVLEEEYLWTFVQVRDLLKQLEKRKVESEKG